MTAQEIIQKLKDSGISIEDFAHEEVGGNIEDYLEAVEAQKVRSEFRAKYLKAYIWEAGKDTEYNNLPNEYYIAKTKFRESLGLNWEEVDQYGGEGKGDTWYSVKYFPEHDVYLKVSGWHASYDGTSFNGWSDCEEVKKVTKTVEVYE
jgi:hypothetical protein